MINNIIAFSVKNKLIIGLLTFAIIAGGAYSLTQIPLDAVPDITNNQVQVITQAPNLSTEDIEQFITYPVELAMANLPDVEEIRSVSRFGLSVVTIVFNDKAGTFQPRQLVSEKLVEVKQDIPSNFGEPYIGPISTGLGEIYQYTLEVDSAHKNSYSPTQLRTIQDWYIKRQMAMVKGVVEINAIGGSIKQYEVAIDPNKLKAMGISISEIFTALEQNNQNTGGAYIEKNHYANFIRGEGLIKSIDEIKSIVVSNQNGLPIKIKDIAEVRFGTAIRYGALTKDGKGEAVGGMILMLKGANSNEVIKLVKERMQQIEKSLPNGIKIVPFLDRSELITKTTKTVSTNLIEGALIVIFVLVLLLGNWRGGLIVASTIPLSLLFALILMHVFDVWANLMSLGAIDFGIIIDGAVIIVEGTVYNIHQRIKKQKVISANDQDDIAQSSASKMMNSAFFGQLIILIVFIPILALQGIEGKMFRPMAYTFMFAMIGVMVLCLTYVPMMSAWFLKVPNTTKESWGDKLIQAIEKTYKSILIKTFTHTKAILATAFALLIGALFLFNNMGAEFIPELDEGDIAFHAMLKPGSALSETVKTTTQIEQIIKKQFPEVESVISRIGVAEVPTDPMPMDIADCFAILKPPSEWRPNYTKKQLVEDIKKATAIVPGVNFEFTQPIEMRFNELITGVREDLAIKIYGDDLEILAQKAQELATLISNVSGVADLKVEATQGLPQITVQYNREKIAQYGLTVAQINQAIQTAFAGGKAGVIFEGEKRFDLVVRLDEKLRKNISDVKSLFIQVPNGNQIPLNELAEINYQGGPMQISRDNTQRRTYVGINIRGRDVKSVVEDMQAIINKSFSLPIGYHIEYGGAFENLERATSRLKFVVPIALLLIFILIFLALGSLKQASIIYIAIPLAAIGGVFSLWFRDMPFSISAGVGFIVLFGVAVLNGLVLMSGWNELKEEGEKDLIQRIVKGASRRVRPIMLTALTDVLGFLPMAISTSAGAEVQQPLATVVIGGIITATLLTLLILPLLYKFIESPKRTPSKALVITSLISIVFIFSISTTQAQTATKPIDDVNMAIELAFKNNGWVQQAESNIELNEQLKKSSFNPQKTDIGVQYGQYNSYHNDFSFNIHQKFELPVVYIKNKQLAQVKLSEAEQQSIVVKNELKYQIRNTWYELSYLNDKRKLLEYKDSMYKHWFQTLKLRYETEDATILEFNNAKMHQMQVANELNLLKHDIEIEKQKLIALINSNSQLEFETASLYDKTIQLTKTDSIANNPELALIEKQIEITAIQKQIEQANVLPQFSLGYFNQSMIASPLANQDFATASDRFTGINAGISIPIFYRANKAQIKMAGIKNEIAHAKAEYQKIQIESQFQQLLQAQSQLLASLEYYEKAAIPQAKLMIEQANRSFTNGAISYLYFFTSLNQALTIRLSYLETLKNHQINQSSIQYILGE